MDEFDVLAEKIATDWYGGELPRHPELLAKVVVALPSVVSLPQVSPAMLEQAKKLFVQSLAAALADRIAAQDAARSPWKC